MDGHFFENTLQPIIVGTNNTDVIEFMKQRYLLANHQDCKSCHQPLRWITRRQSSDGYSWKCINKKCASSWLAIRKGSFFEKSHISLKKWLHITYLWCLETSEKQAAQLTGISQRTIVEVYHFYREVCSVYFRANPVLLGGPGRSVQVDESSFSRKIKYHRGHVPDGGIWVFGIVDTSTTPAVGYMEAVPNRSLQTLLPIIRRVVRPGSTVHSESWVAYNNIQPAINSNQGDPHIRFVSPIAAHTQPIESYWNKCKALIKRKRGVLRDLLPTYLAEFMWRDRFGEDAFNALLLHIAEQFPIFSSKTVEPQTHPQDPIDPLSGVMDTTVSEDISTPSQIYEVTGQGHIEFDEVAVYFSKAEWDHLNNEQKELYKDVMMENYRTLRSLGCVNLKPTIVSKIERGEDLYMICCQKTVEDQVPTNSRAGQASKYPACKITTYTTKLIKQQRNYLERNASERENGPPQRSTAWSTNMQHLISFESTNGVTEYNDVGGETSFICSECGKCLSRRSSLLQHQKIHTGYKPHLCADCGKCFSRKLHLVEHQRIHTGEKPYACSECGKCFIQRSRLVVHVRSHTGERPFVCSNCGKWFHQKHKLAMHLRIHSGEKPFVCAECGKCFAMKRILVRHKLTHKGEKTCVCSECGKCFGTTSDLAKHQITHTRIKPFACPECGKCFGYKFMLVTHLRSHTGEKLFECSKCGKGFALKRLLSRHEMIHTGDQPFTCAECGKRFCEKTTLARHQMTHTGEKPFVCSECGKSFINHSDMLKHQRVHTGDKPFACAECGKSFSLKNSLVTHQRIHTGQKPFTCSECGKCFTQRPALLRHQNVHTKT